MGFGRTGDGAVGIAAVKRTAGLLLAAGLLGGCSTVGNLVSVGAGAAAGSFSANPAVGLAVGIGVQAGLDEVFRYINRRRQQGEQDAIADAAGTAPLNQPRAWEIRHTIPIGNARGTLVPVRDIPTSLAQCREILFSVQGGGVFTTAVCRGGEGWKWAAAEPAVDRWGLLQ